MNSSEDRDVDPPTDASVDGSETADGGYVHDPESAGAGAGSETETSACRRVPTPTATDEPDPGGFGRTGWVLVTAVVVCFVVIPGIIYLYPYVLGSFGLTFFGTYLVLPLIPAVLLGIVAVWSMTAAT